MTYEQGHELKKQAQHLKAVVMIGQKDLGKVVLNEIDITIESDPVTRQLI